MVSIGMYSVADLFFKLKWSSGYGSHTDAYAGRQVNLWRDLLPARLTERVMGKGSGDRAQLEFAPGELFHGNAKTDIRRLSRAQFDPERIGAPDLAPRLGRFYPKGLLKDVAGIFCANIEPFRCLEINGNYFAADLGHPLAGFPLSLSVTVGAVAPKSDERGGSMRDWVETISQGVGMQAPWRGQATDFFSPSAFGRQDEAPDAAFYETPRMVQHMDDTALDVVRALYGRFIRSGMNVLDLMASWDSHLPFGLSLPLVTGIGLNAVELSRNEALTDYLVHDLNLDPAPALPQNAYDAAVCTGSVEYLTSPKEVFDCVAGALRPGGHFIVSFSNRWFQPKAIALWAQLHEFERMGLILEYFRTSKSFTDLHTYSLRGLDRPVHDKYSGQLPFADPVYAVWGRRA